MAGLPQSVIDIAERAPIEDVILPILRDGLPDIRIGTLVEFHPGFPFVHMRRKDGLNTGGWTDPRFINSGLIGINAFCEDPNGDEDAAILSEACRVVLRDAWLSAKVVPGRGHISYYEERQAPRRAADWSTAVGPVQYADLPTGVTRYEATYFVVIRPAPTSNP